jgi:acetyl esterase
MSTKLDRQAQELMSRVWPRYTAAAPAPGEPVDIYRAERDAYVREINVSDAVVKSVELIEIPGPAGAIPVRIYRPLGEAAEPLPVLLYLHGGGWTVGGGDTIEGSYRAYCAAVPCIVFVPDYRLAPEHKFPAAVEDSLASARWLAAHAAEIGGDADRIVLCGESSGGNLAAVISDVSRRDPSLRLLLQVLIYPALDLGAATHSYQHAEDPFTRDKMRWYINCYIRDAADIENPLGSPLRATDFTGLPKTVLVTGGADPLLDEAAQYAEKLREAGVTLDYLCLEGWPHGFAFWPESDAYRRTMDFTVAAIREAFGL